MKFWFLFPQIQNLENSLEFYVINILKYELNNKHKNLTLNLNLF